MCLISKSRTVFTHISEELPYLQRSDAKNRDLARCKYPYKNPRGKPYLETRVTVVTSTHADYTYGTCHKICSMNSALLASIKTLVCRVLSVALGCPARQQGIWIASQRRLAAGQLGSCVCKDPLGELSHEKTLSFF